MAASTRWILWSREEPTKLEERAALVAVSTGEPPADATARSVGIVTAGAVAVTNGRHGKPTESASGRSAPTIRRAEKRSRSRIRQQESSPSVALDPTAIHDIIDARAIGVVYQPIVDIRYDQVVGFEALARGPKGPFESPLQLFAAARAKGRAGELDWICRAQAFRTFMAAELPASLSLFVNVEPDSLIDPCPEDLLPVIWEAETRLRVFVDIPGKALSRHPREVLQTVRRARVARWGISLDDTEFSSAGLALLPVVEPDVIRLHERVLDADMATSAAAFAAAISEMHRIGTTLLVENVEHPATRRLGEGIGAAFQQGHLFGREGQLPPELSSPRRAIRLLDRPAEEPTTPFHIVNGSNGGHVHEMTTDGVETLALAMTHHAASANPVPALATVLPRASELTLMAQTSYRMLLERTPLAMLLGPNMSRYEDWNICVAAPAADHYLAETLCVLTIAPGSCSVLTANPSRNRRPDTWDVALSEDPAICRQVMRQLLQAMDNMAGGILHELNGAERA
jgi:EAL domain-containing protein (putative c-di-GMP-specific phosphodiesterase class I)